MSSNRETERDRVVTFVNAGMVGSGKPLQSCYGYQAVDEWAGEESPTMVISSAGTLRPSGDAGNTEVTFYFNADNFVIYEDGSWTADKAEDKLDEIEKDFFDLLTANRTSTRKYFYNGPSRAGSVVVKGKEYRRERIPFGVTLFNG